MKVGINGFGRIGRNVAKSLLARYPNIEIVAINDLTSAAELAHLFRFDSNYGTFAGNVTSGEGTLSIDGRAIAITAERDPAKIPWSKFGADLVIESTGLFTDATKARAHIDGGGVRKVLISAPAKNEDVTIVLGVNEHTYDPDKHHVISNASCTTNCLATAVKPIVDSFGWKNGFMTTVHSYTNDQNILDAPHRDLRRARNAATNIIPTSTGAAKALGLTIPEVKGKFDGFALRVPTPVVSMIYLVAQVNRPVTKDEINAAYRTAVSGELGKYVHFSEDELVSSDFKMSPHSSIIDSKLTNAAGDLIQIAAWYDNEWGYSSRLADLTQLVLAKNAGEGLRTMSSAYKSVRDLDVRGKRVLLRVDLNLPMKNGVVKDETRLTAALPTLRYLHENGARTIIMSHLGRPDGKAAADLSLQPVATLLAERLSAPVAFATDCIGAPAGDAVGRLKDGEFLMLENLRFHAEEEKNDPAFVKSLASLGDLYVNDAFGTAHRAHASTEGLAHELPAAAGLLLEAELEALNSLTKDIVRPYVCAIGGSKIADKVRVFESLIEKVDAFVVGGGMANTFLAAQGKAVGTSLRDANLSFAQHILELAKAKHVVIHLPADAVASPSFDDEAAAEAVDLDNLGDRMILDIGPKSAKAYADVLRTAKTVIFNGPMGVYEKAPYRDGTRVICEAIAEATKNGAVTVVGGGDAAAAAQMLGFGEAFSHVSTGGGAMLEYLEGKTLPGVAALESTAKV